MLDLGCANPANHLSQGLLPAATPSASKQLRCFATRQASSGSTPSGLSPAQIRSAYKLGSASAHGRTVAIIDAYDDPNAEADLAVYRRYWKLPACTMANGCFRKLNQKGATNPLPAADAGWAAEIALDLEAVSATCPSCKIRLIEASSPDTVPLLTAVATAVRLKYRYISNSYGGDEDSTIRSYDKYFHHDGVVFTASSGDDGYGVSWPASSPYVTAVGGTTLLRSTNSRGWTEKAWSGTGSGCSRYEPKPSWQKDRGCSRRTVADVAAVADPATGLAVYGTYNNCTLPILVSCDDQLATGAAQGLNGWTRIGGTSLSAPIIASVYALAGRTVHYGSYSYSHRTALYDPTTGSTGNCHNYLCTAIRGYDGPTGHGTPNGLGAF